MSKITLPIAELKPALTGLGKIIAKRTTLPVLNHIKIERTKDGWVALTATDLDSFITVRLEQPSEAEPITLLVPFDELQKITKSCQKTDSVLISGDKESVTIEYAVGSQVAEAKVGSLPVEEFPEIPRIKGEPVPIPDNLRQSIHQALDCASTDETRLILNSAYIDVSQKEGHYVVGTNGSHLYASNSFKLPLKECLVLPSHKFLSYREFNADGEWVLKTAEPEHKDDQLWFQITSRRWRFIARQFDGAYPNWRQVTLGQKEFNTSVRFEDPEKLAQTIERLPDHDLVNHAIGIERKQNAVNVLWKSDKEQPWKKLPVAVESSSGKDITIYVNRIYLIKGLRFGMSRVSFIDHMSPMQFSHEGRQMVVMPVRAESAPPTPTAAPQAQETPSEPAVTDDAAQPERTPPMVKDTTSTSTTGTEPVTIDSQLDQLLEEVETMKVTVQDHLTGLKSLGTKLKAVQREHKTSNKELSTIRQTLKGLQSMKL